MSAEHTTPRAKVSRQVRRATVRGLTKIQWTGRTWQVTSGCREWSPGCLNCYARRDARRMGSNPNEKVRQRYEGLVVLKNDELRWSGAVRELPEQLTAPLRWRERETIFVNSLSDLFQEGVSFEYIAAVFGVMAMCGRHTFQVLTKRPDRMRAWAVWITAEAGAGNEIAWCVESATELIHGHADDVEAAVRLTDRHVPVLGAAWPLANVWLGTSVEDQRRANERVPELLAVPAAVRFLSCEPLLEAVDLSRWLMPHDDGPCPVSDPDCEADEDGFHALCERPPSGIAWVITGGESGPGARSCNLAWLRHLVVQCSRAAVSVFVKQLGARPTCSDCNSTGFEGGAIGGPRCAGCNATSQQHMRDRKGGDMDEWPEDLRVRQMPEVRHV